MTADDFALPPDLDHWAFGFMLVLARVAGAITMLPSLGESTLPSIVRAGLALCITVLLLPGLLGEMPLPPDASLTAAAMVASEVATGVWFGWLARLLTQALPLAGQYIAYMMGVSNVLQANAELGPQTAAITQLFDAAVPVLILVTGLYTLPLTALTGLYRLIPAGTLVPGADSAQTAVRLMSEMFALALRLASPFIVANIVWHVAIGLMARFLPRLQVYFVALPGQVLGGLVLLASLAGVLLSAWQGTVRAGLSALPGSG